MTAPDLTALADRLAETTANLDAHIAAAADRLAAPRIAAAEHAAELTLAQLQAEHQVDANRAADLQAEFRRQLDAQIAMVARLRWAARYLPPAIRSFVLADPVRPEAWAGERPDTAFADRLDAAAAAADLTSYPGSRQHVPSGATR